MVCFQDALQHIPCVRLESGTVTSNVVPIQTCPVHAGVRRRLGTAPSACSCWVDTPQGSVPSLPLDERKSASGDLPCQRRLESVRHAHSFQSWMSGTAPGVSRSGRGQWCAGVCANQGQVCDLRRSTLHGRVDQPLFRAHGALEL